MVSEVNLNLATDEGMYKQWMKNLSEENKNKNLNHLSIPGTHDSGANTLDWEHPVQNSCFNLSRKVFCCYRNIANSWAITQNQTITQQLNSGIRYFDLRISFNNSANQFYLSHTYACESLEEILLSIGHFLEENSEEIVILNMCPDWANREQFYQKTDQFDDLIYRTLVKKKLLFLPTIDLKLPTLKKMISQNRRILAIWSGDPLNISSNNFFWNQSCYQTYWEDTSNLQKKANFLQQWLDKIPDNSNQFYEFPITLTPQPMDVTYSILERFFKPWRNPEDLQTLAHQINDYCKEHFFAQQSEKLKKVSIFTTDWPDQGYVERVINLNNP